MPSNKPEVIGPGGFGPIKLPKFNIGMPARFSFFAIIGIVVIAALAILYNVCFIYIRPYEVGIKQVNIGMNPGIRTKVYPPGLAFRIPFGFEVIHRFPQHVQVLDLTEGQIDRDMPSYSRENATMIQTSDGFSVDVDVSILYKIVDPYKVITTLGPGEQYLYQGILPKAQPVLKEALGELTTEDFYNSPLRTEKADRARELLHDDLEPKGIEVEHVLVRYFRYSDEIQKNIEAKKLQDQMVFKNQSEARAAIEEAHVKKVIQEGEAFVAVALEQGNAYKVEKDAERDLYVRSKTAQADLLVQLAEAKRTELRNTAMQSAGAERAVVMKMAEVLRGLDTIIVPTGGPGGMNPLDLNQIMNMFGANNIPTEPAAEPAGEVAASETFQQLFGGATKEEN